MHGTDDSERLYIIRASLILSCTLVWIKSVWLLPVFYLSLARRYTLVFLTHGWQYDTLPDFAFYSTTFSLCVSVFPPFLHTHTHIQTNRYGKPQGLLTSTSYFLFWHGLHAWLLMRISPFNLLPCSSQSMPVRSLASDRLLHAGFPSTFHPQCMDGIAMPENEWMHHCGLRNLVHAFVGSILGSINQP